MKLTPLILIGLIIWSRPDGGISITHGFRGSSEAEAQRLINNGSIPGDWDPVAYDVEIPSTRAKRDQWRWDSNSRSIKDDLPAPVRGGS